MKDARGFNCTGCSEWDGHVAFW